MCSGMSMSRLTFGARWSATNPSQTPACAASIGPTMPPLKRRMENSSRTDATRAPHLTAIPWKPNLDLAYFSGYAIWNYLNSPFLFLLPGVETEEIEPWDEHGEQRRRLTVTFPDSIATHCSEQVFHIGSDGLISRMDYSAAVTGGVPTAHYSSDYRDFDGIKIATRRRAYRRNPDGTAHTNFIAVAIDIADIRLS